MKKIISLALVLLVTAALAGCKQQSTDVYRTLYDSELTTLNYLLTGNDADQLVGANCIDTLIEYNSHGVVQPALALSWQTDPSGLVWTFALRDKANWYDCTGLYAARVTANDFVAAAKYALTAEYDSACNGPLFNLKNAEAYYLGEISDFSLVGVRAVDDYTLEYTLESPLPYFLSLLSYGCFMPAYGPMLENLGADFATDNEKMLYCGAYILSEYEPQVRQLYTKNQNNWDADNIYIEMIEKTYNAEAATLAPVMVLRGELDYASLSVATAADWLNSHPEYVSLARSQPKWSYFYSFNFDPRFDEEYEPENWKIAVNNLNFRLAIVHALNREYTLTALDPINYKAMLQNSITPRGFVNLDGTDFADFADFDGFTYYDSSLAAKYKLLAVSELEAAGASFPIKIYVPYNPSSTGWAEECVLLEQQLEGELGSDFIDIIAVAGPSEGFLSATRRAGNYAFMKTNWGADYLDPSTYADPFDDGNSYQFMYTASADDPVTAQTAALAAQYYKIADEARAELANMQLRYELFAEAEMFLIENALVIPYSTSTVSYQATRLNVYEGQYAAFGISLLRYKGQSLRDEFVSMETQQLLISQHQSGQ